MSTWTITNGTASGTFAALALANLRRTRVSQAADTVDFDAPGAAFDSAPLFSYGESVTISQDGATWFVGTCISNPAQGTDAAERIAYQVAGPWWWLEQIDYLQVWRVYSIADAELQNTYKSRVILNQDADGNRITSGAQIQAVINYCISKGAPMQLGTVDPDLNLPWEECLTPSCAEVIVKMLRLSPDCVTWFDYSTSPYPTFHCRKRANLSALSLACTSGDPAAAIRITPRYDLQIPGISLRYEQTHSVGSSTYETVSLDEAGDVADIRSVIATIELAGSRASLLTQKIVTGDWPADMTSSTWWKAQLPWLDESTITDITIHDVALDPDPKAPRILTEGTVQDWMDELTADQLVSAKADFVVKDGSGNTVEVVLNHPVAVRRTGTNAETGTYRKIGDAVSGEAVPTGVAAALYAAWSQLPCDGGFSLIEEEVSGNAYPGRKLNLTGGRTAWASMNALIQQVTENVDQGHTAITFGPARHIDPDDLVALLTSLRSRRTAIGHNLRVSGDSGDADIAVDLSGPAPKLEPASGGGETRRLVIQHFTGDTLDKDIDLDPDAATADGQVLQFWTESGVRKGKIQYAKFHS